MKHVIPISWPSHLTEVVPLPCQLTTNSFSQLGFLPYRTAPGLFGELKGRQRTSTRVAEQIYRSWCSNLLELKERDHQLAPSDRQALENDLAERRLLHISNSCG